MACYRVMQLSLLTACIGVRDFDLDEVDGPAVAAQNVGRKGWPLPVGSAPDAYPPSVSFETAADACPAGPAPPVAGGRQPLDLCDCCCTPGKAHKLRETDAAYQERVANGGENHAPTLLEGCSFVHRCSYCERPLGVVKEERLKKERVWNVYDTRVLKLEFKLFRATRSQVMSGSSMLHRDSLDMEVSDALYYTHELSWSDPDNAGREVGSFLLTNFWGEPTAEANLSKSKSRTSVARQFTVTHDGKKRRFLTSSPEAAAAWVRAINRATGRMMDGQGWDGRCGNQQVTCSKLCSGTLHPNTTDMPFTRATARELLVETLAVGQWLELPGKDLVAWLEEHINDRTSLTTNPWLVAAFYGHMNTDNDERVPPVSEADRGFGECELYQVQDKAEFFQAVVAVLQKHQQELKSVPQYTEAVDGANIFADAEELVSFVGHVADFILGKLWHHWRAKRAIARD